MNILDEIKQVEANAEKLYTVDEIVTAIGNMAEKINLLLADRNPLILTILNGGIVLAGNLLPFLNFPLTIDTINISRYKDKTSGGEIDWMAKPDSQIQGRTLLIVDDILDEGLTLQAIYQYCSEQGAASIYSAVLIDKILKHPKPVQADFVGLQAENRYLFGYGMDYKGYLRNVAGIYACKALS